MTTSKNNIQMPVKDFAKKIICDGHLYLITKEGRKFYLMKPGVLIDSEFIKKHATLNTVFDFVPVQNEKLKKEFALLLKELCYLQFEKDMREKAKQIVRLFEASYSKNEHFLSFSLASFEVFCDLNMTLVTKMHETDIYLFRKALYSASFAIIIGLTNDLYNPVLLKDLYKATFLLDAGLCDAEYSYYVAQACNEENRNPGQGRAWLAMNNATTTETQVFLMHPDKSYQLLKTNPEILANKELAEISLYQHELADGTGFPRGVPKGLVSNWESVVILADSMVEIQDDYSFENKVLDFIFNFQNKKMTDLPVAKVYKKLCLSMKYFKELEEKQA